MRSLRLIDRVRIAFGISILFTGFVLVIMYVNMRKSVQESEHVRITLSRLDHLDNILAKVNTIESGQRGYVISGDTSFLKGYTRSLETLDEDLENLIVPSNDTDAETKAIIALVNQKTAHAKFVVEARRIIGYDSAAAMVKRGEGKKMMDSMIDHLSRAEEKEKTFLAKANAERARYAGSLSWLFFILAALLCVGTITGYLFILRDYQKTERTNRVLAYNSILLKNISDAIVTTDADYNITDWNIYAEQLFGYTAAEVKGKNPDSVLHLQFSGTDMETAKASLLKHETWKGEVIQYDRAGNPVHTDVSASVLKNDAGEFIGTLNVIRDISQRVQLETDLKLLTTDLQKQVTLKANELNLFFERIADAFIALDNNWNYTYLNKAAIDFHGSGAETLIGKNIWEVFPDVVNEPFYEALQEAKATQKPVRKQLYFSKGDKWFEDLIYPGKEGISVYYRDITTRKKAEEKLRISEEALKFSNDRYELVAKATKDAIWDWDMRSDRLMGNESFCRFFGIEGSAAITYADFIANIHPDDRQKLKENFKSILKRREAVLTEEYRFITGVGKNKVIYNRAYILYNDANRAYRMLGAMQDITDIKEAEQKILLEKELSDSIINSLPGIFYLFNKKGAFHLWNKNFETVSGYSARDISAMHPLSFFADEEQELLQEKIGNVFSTGNDNVEALFITKQGGKIPYYFTGRLINYEGEECLMGVGIDVSEKVRSQQELVNSEEKFRTLIHQASDGIIIVYEDGTPVDVNETLSMLTGFSREELMNMKAYELFYDSDPQQRVLLYEQMKKGLTVITERSIKKKDGSLLDVEVSSKQMPGGLYQGIIRDITERKRTEEELQRSHEALRELASHLETVRENERTHMAREIHDELGQQLTGLKMDISWLGKKIKSDDEAINEKIKDTIELIDKTVITVRRIATQLRPSILDDLGLVAAMEWQSDEFGKRSDISTVFISNVAHISIKPEIATGIFRIFQESLTNVLRHSKATRVKISFIAKEDLLTLVIEDNGVGFDEEAILNKKTLGLLGMKERALLIKGNYEIKGNIGKGASVIITVPLS